MNEPESKTRTEVEPAAKILLYSTKIVGRECAVVEEFGKPLEELVNVLRYTMYDHRGVGLAAPQIGVFKRLAIVQLVEDRTRPPFVMVNPAIVNTAGVQTDWEGCLSLPGNGTRQRVTRPFFVKVVYQDISGKTEQMEVKGMMARAIQHECDHLQGKFFIDHLSQLKRGIVLKHYRKVDEFPGHLFIKEEPAHGGFVLVTKAPCHAVHGPAVVNGYV